MAISGERADIVAGLLRDGDRILLVHRSPLRRVYPDVWDLPGGHVEAGELPGVAVARELREELGIEVAVPSASPFHAFRGTTYDMRIWLFEVWGGVPFNAAPDEHDAIGWFTVDGLGGLRLAHDSYVEMARTAVRRLRA